MPWLATSQRTFKVPPDPNDHSEAFTSTEPTEQQARQWAFQQLQDAFQNDANTESIQVEITKF
jgi:hypothetical protein